MKECHFCKKKVDKLYELRGWKGCWDCYYEIADREAQGIQGAYEQARADDIITFSQKDT